jgi:hypothetical protein
MSFSKKNLINVLIAMKNGYAIYSNYIAILCVIFDVFFSFAPQNGTR